MSEKIPEQMSSEPFTFVTSKHEAAQERSSGTSEKNSGGEKGGEGSEGGAR